MTADLTVVENASSSVRLTPPIWAGGPNGAETFVSEVLQPRLVEQLNSLISQVFQCHAKILDSCGTDISQPRNILDRGNTGMLLL